MRTRRRREAARRGLAAERPSCPRWSHVGRSSHELARVANTSCSFLLRRAMGNFLDTPITEKETEVGEDASALRAECDAGWRAQMEDDHIQMLGERRAAQRITIRRLRRARRRHGRALLGAPLPQHLTDALDAGDPARPRRLDGKANGIRVVADGARQRAAAPAGRGVGAGPRADPVQALSRRRRSSAPTRRFARGPRARRRRRAARTTTSRTTRRRRRDRGGGVARQFNRVNGDLAVSRALGDRQAPRPSPPTAKPSPPSRRCLAAAAPALARARPRPSIAPAQLAAPAGGLRRRPRAPPGLNPAHHRDGSLTLHLLRVRR